MKKYEAYKDSGIKWFGDIPSHWGVEPFGRHFRYGKGLPITKANLLSEGVAVISYGQIHSKLNTGTTMTENLVRFVSPEYLKTNPQSLLKHNDFIFADTSEDVEGSGNCAFNDYPEHIFAGYHTVIARPVDLQFPRYYAYLFQSQSWKSQIQSFVNGVKVYSINKSILKKSSLLFPPLVEQETIVAFLDKKTKAIDDLVAQVEREIVLLKEYKQAEIARAVTKGLNPNTPMKPSGISWIGDIPEHWEIKRLGSAFTENRNLNTKLESTEAYKFNYGALVRKDEDVNLTDEILETYRKYTVIKPNDILINGLNLNYDFISQRVAISCNEGIITSAYLAMTPRDNVNPVYYNYLLKSMDAMKLFHGMGTGIRLTLSFAELRKQLILFPPMREQKEIVDYIVRKTAEIDRLVVELTYQVEYLKEYKQRLIADVVTGKINVQPN